MWHCSTWDGWCVWEESSFIYGHSATVINRLTAVYTVCGIFTLTFTILNMISYKNEERIRPSIDPPIHPSIHPNILPYVGSNETIFIFYSPSYHSIPVWLSLFQNTQKEKLRNVLLLLKNSLLLLCSTEERHLKQHESK